MAMASSLAEVFTTGTATSGSGAVRTTATTTMEIERGTTIQAVSEDRKGMATLRTAMATTRTATTRTAMATLGMATNSDAPTTTMAGTEGLSATMAPGNKALPLLLRRLRHFVVHPSMKRKWWGFFHVLGTRNTRDRHGLMLWHGLHFWRQMIREIVRRLAGTVIGGGGS